MSVTSKISSTLCQRNLLLSAVLAIALFGANSYAQDSGSLPTLDLDRPLRLDFSGSWEKDFRRSDNWEDELNRTLRIRQEAAARQQASPGSRVSSRPSVSVGGINVNQRRGRGENIVNLARLAEYISRQTTMQIIQNRDEVRIQRRDEADLVCSVENIVFEAFSNQHGAEVCGWDRQQLVFQISLPGGLTVVHRLSVSADSSLLNMVTSISSGGNPPFNLRQAFNRYQAPPEQFNCTQTLSRGKVCRQTTSGL